MNNRVIAAVNELESVWPAGYINSIAIKEGVVTCEEFNQCVEDCSNNKGWENIVKDKLTIGNSYELDELNSIKGAFDKGLTYECLIGDDDDDEGAVYKQGVEYKTNGTGIVDEYDRGSMTSHCCTGWTTFKLIKMPESTPVYTQAMCDAGELPSVGMECLVKRFHAGDSELLGGYIIGYSQDKCWLVFETVDDELLYHNIKNGTFVFKPLTPITPPIELIDGCAYQFDARGKTLMGIFSHHGDKLCIHDGYYFDKETCTNIQPLEVAK